MAGGDTTVHEPSSLCSSEGAEAGARTGADAEWYGQAISEDWKLSPGSAFGFCSKSVDERARDCLVELRLLILAD